MSKKRVLPERVILAGGQRWGRGRRVWPDPNPKPPRVRRIIPVEIREIAMYAQRVRSDVIERYMVDTLGWFGDNENGHVHLTKILNNNRSFASMQYLLDALREQEFHHFIFIEKLFDETLAETGLILCEQNFNAWTSFKVYRDGYSSLVCFATHEPVDLVKITLALPSWVLENKVDVDD